MQYHSQHNMLRAWLKEAYFSPTLLLLSWCTAGAGLKRAIQTLPYWPWLLRLGCGSEYVKRSSCLSLQLRVCVCGVFFSTLTVCLLVEENREGGLDEVSCVHSVNVVGLVFRGGEASWKSGRESVLPVPPTFFPSRPHFLFVQWLGIIVTFPEKGPYSPRVPKLD